MLSRSTIPAGNCRGYFRLPAENTRPSSRSPWANSGGGATAIGPFVCCNKSNSHPCASAGAKREGLKSPKRWHYFINSTSSGKPKADAGGVVLSGTRNNQTRSVGATVRARVERG